MRPIYIWWLCWFFGSVGSFLAVEVWGLATNPDRTLSEAIWHLEELRRGQPIGQWSASHVLFLGFWLLVGFVWVWLFGHFIFGKWH